MTEHKPTPAYVDAPYQAGGVFFIDGEWKEVSFDGENMTVVDNNEEEEEPKEDV